MNFIEDIPARSLVEGITGHYAHGVNMTFGLVKIVGGSNLPAHQHPHEQITYIIDGELDMIIGEQQVKLTPGMYHIIPSNIMHGATAVTDCTLIDVFNPVREDYRP